MIYKVTYILYFSDKKSIVDRQYDCSNIIDLWNYFIDSDYCTLNKVFKPDWIEVKVG